MALSGISLGLPASGKPDYLSDPQTQQIGKHALNSKVPGKGAGSLSRANSLMAARCQPLRSPFVSPKPPTPPGNRLRCKGFLPLASLQAAGGQGPRGPALDRPHPGSAWPVSPQQQPGRNQTRAGYLAGRRGRVGEHESAQEECVALPSAHLASSWPS